MTDGMRLWYSCNSQLY